MDTARERQSPTRSLGAYGERVAARHLTALGMTVLDRNWRCPTGEIDLVLRDGAVLVVCEVKTRRGLVHGHPVAAVRDRKLLRLQHLALFWMEEHGVAAPEVRIDVVGVVQPRHGAPQVEHLRGIG
jgi:putative endonuclease